MGGRKQQPQQIINAEPEMMQQIRSIAEFLEHTLGTKYQVSFQQLDGSADSGKIVVYPHDSQNTLVIQSTAGLPKALLQICPKTDEGNSLTATATSLPQAKSAGEVATQAAQELIVKKGVPANRLNMEEKIEIVQALSKNGIFQLKGSVSNVARQLHCSEPSVYRYISIANRTLRRNA